MNISSFLLEQPPELDHVCGRALEQEVEVLLHLVALNEQGVVDLLFCTLQLELPEQLLDQEVLGHLKAHPLEEASLEPASLIHEGEHGLVDVVLVGEEEEDGDKSE